MASTITTEFRAEFQKLLKQEKAIPYNELLMNLLTCMEKHGLLDERERDLCKQDAGSLQEQEWFDA